MDQLALMRRANGDLFTLTLKGKEYLAFWPSLETAINYKARNPELVVFFPISVTQAFGKKNRVAFPAENMGLLLLTENSDSQFGDARKMTWEEVENRIPAPVT